MRVLVTGGAGFIGAHLVDELMERGYEVTVYDNLSWGREEFLREHFGKENFKFVRGDLLDPQALKEAVRGQDFVHHLAANPDIRRGPEQPDLDLKQNVFATFNLLEAMRSEGVRSLSFSSSSTVYGEARALPTPEDYGPLLPISLYGASKLAAEALISAYCHTFGFRAWIFRFANIVGPRQTHGVIVDFLEKLRRNWRELEVIGDGNQTKDYLYISDAVDATMLVLKRGRLEGEAYNVGSGESLTVREIVEMILEAVGLKGLTGVVYTGKSWAGDVPVTLADVSRLRRIGFEPKVHVREGLGMFIEWYEGNYGKVGRDATFGWTTI